MEPIPNSKKVKLTTGQKGSFCSCGQSKTLPFCDDSHREYNAKNGSTFRPVKIWPDRDVEIDAYCSNWEEPGSS